MDYKISAGVVLYNPNDDTYENIASYALEVDTLIVVDNSTLYNSTLIAKLKKNFSNLIYIDNHGNLGIATALNLACNKAIESGSQWILTMDQDSHFFNFRAYLNCLDKLEETKEIALLAANTLWHPTQDMIENTNCEYEEKRLVITSANLLNLSLFHEIGGFEDKLFIDMVDHDYCMKILQKKYKILFFKNIIVKHEIGNFFQRKNLITGKIRNKIEHYPQRTYYIARNMLYLSKQYSKLYPKEYNFLRTLNILFIHDVTKILLYEDMKLAKLSAKITALYHFVLGKYGKYDL